MSHRVVERWMGQEIETLEDLLRPQLRAACIGINPAPTSVAAGHYYQGRLGQQFFARLQIAGAFERGRGWDDDVAYERGIGFTDIVKRPTRAATEVMPEEFTFGRELLAEKMRPIAPRLLIFTFKKTAEVMLGRFPGSGAIGKTISDVPVYVMPGPYAPRHVVTAQLSDLKRLLNETSSSPGSD
jgi:TDG/mug DNA glycosylase family protein